MDNLDLGRPPTNTSYSLGGAGYVDISMASTSLAAELSRTQQGHQQLKAPDTCACAVETDCIVFPAYSGGYIATPWDVIHDQSSYDAACKSVERVLATGTLSDAVLLHCLSTGFFQSPLGRMLAPWFLEALMRSVPARSDLPPEQLRENLAVICKLPPAQWANVFGERLDVPRVTQWERVDEFIKAQVERSRPERAVKIVNGELLPNEQWLWLQNVVKDCRPFIGPWLEGSTDRDPVAVHRLHDTLCKLEDFVEVRPRSLEARFLLGEFLERLDKARGGERFPEQYKKQIEELRQSIELKPAPSWSVAELMSMRHSLFRDASESCDNETEEPLSEGDLRFVETVEAIQRRGDYFNHVKLGGPRPASGWPAKLLYVGYVAREVSGLAASFYPSHHSLPARYQMPRSAPEPESAASFSDTPFAQLESLILKLDEWFAHVIRGVTGYHPAEAVELGEALNEIKEKLTTVNVKTPFASVPPSSYGTPGNPYTSTVAPLEPDTLDKLRAGLAQWLEATTDYLAVAGVATLHTATAVAREHPRATATVALTAIYAAVNAFHSRWFGETTPNEDSHFVQENDPVLRKYISDDVGLILSEMPDLVLTIKARLEASSHAAPHRDPQLIPDIKRLLTEPVLTQPDQTVAELIDESIFESRDRYARLGYSRLFVDEDELTLVAEEDIPSLKLTDDSAQWVLEALSDAEITSLADEKLQSLLLERLEANQNTPLSVPADSSMNQPLALYKQTLNDPAVLAWFKSKGLALDTLIIHESSVSGTITREGVSSTQTFNLWDSSGWWQVSALVLAARRVLDPGDFGMPLLDDDQNLVPCNVVLDFYKVAPPYTDEEAAELALRLKKEGWLPITPEDQAQITQECDEVIALIAETKSRVQLIQELKAVSENLADDAPLSLSGRFTRSSNHLPLTDACAEIVEDLNAFLTLADMKEICKDASIDCDFSPVRICENKIEALVSSQWKDLTSLVNAQSTLTGPFSDLLKKVKQTGNTLYSTLSIDLQQVINYRGFGSPKTAGAVRNVIQWLNTTLPSAPPFGDYGADLLGNSESLIQLTPAERATIISHEKSFFTGSSSIIDTLGADLLADTSVEYRRTHVDELLGKMFEMDECVSWGHELLHALNWYGAGQTALPEHYQALLLAAIKLAVDPDAPGRPGNVAGYDVYQPKNLGRDLVTVRAEVEQHLIDHKGVSAQAAPLIAHLFLAEAAPEFLALEPDPGILVGSVSWMSLRQGVAITEMQRPGSSRALTANQLTMIALLGPTTPEQRLLFKSAAVDILMTWGVMNGVVQSNVAYSFADYSLVANRFATQRVEFSQVVEGFNQPLVTRREIAIEELGKVFSFFTTQAIEEIKIEADVFEPLDKFNPVRKVKRTLVEAYMDGDLYRHTWKMSSRPMNQGVFDRCVFTLPVLNHLLAASVNRFINSRKNALVTSTKALIASLPLEDRQCIEQGEVQLFTLREETGRPKEDETTQTQAAFRGRQGTLLRCKYREEISYFEIFPGRLSIIKRTDLPEDLPLNGEIKIEKARVSKGSTVNVKVQRGTELPFDFAAYSQGSVPIAGVKSPKLIIESFGDALPAATVQGRGQTALVPDSYGSIRTATIVDRVINGNFLQGERDFLLKKAKGQTTAEENREYWKKVESFLLQLIPFVGCTDDLQSGDRVRFINGAFGCFTDLVSGLNTLGGGAIRITKALSSLAPVSIKAFEAIKISAATLISLVNPLDGIPDLVAGGARVTGSFRRILTSGVFALTDSGIGHLQVCLDRLRAFFGGAASGASARLPRSIAATMGHVNGSEVARVDNKWYALDFKGNPIGRALDESRVQRA